MRAFAIEYFIEENGPLQIGEHHFEYGCNNDKRQYKYDIFTVPARVRKKTPKYMCFIYTMWTDVRIVPIRSSAIGTAILLFFNGQMFR